VVPAAPLPTVTLTASPAQVTAGSSTTLAWSSADADSCTASGGWSGARATSGSQVISNLSSTTTFTLDCTGGGGSTSRSVTVEVVPAAPLPTVTLTASPAQVTAGSSTTLTWSSADADSCTASGGWSGERATSGSETVAGLSATTSFTLSCTGAGGTASSTATVGVSAPPPAPSLSFWSMTEKVNQGREATLRWEAAGVTSCTAGGAWSGAREITGAERVAVPDRRVEFELTCEGGDGAVTERVVVQQEVFCKRPRIQFEITPEIVQPGATADFRWYTANTGECHASGDWSGPQALMGAQTIGPINEGQSFALQCKGDLGAMALAHGVGVGARIPLVQMTVDFSEVDLDGEVGRLGFDNNLSWTTLYADSCEAYGGWAGNMGTFGQSSLPKLMEEVVYGLVCSGPGGEASVELVVSPVADNQRPVLRPDFIQLEEGVPFAAVPIADALYANDEDPDGCLIGPRGSWIGNDTGGLWSEDLSELVFGPDDAPMFFGALEDLSGDVGIAYILYDNRGGRALDVGRATVQLAPRDDVPQLTPDIGAVVAGQNVFLRITANDLGLDEPYTLTISSPPANGTVSLGSSVTGGAISRLRYWFANYRPAAGFSGADSFEYRVVDADGDEATALVTVEIFDDQCIADGTLTPPLAGIPGIDWRLIESPDVLPDIGAAADGRGGFLARDQGRDTVFLVGDMDDINRPVPVVAMQCGRVIEQSDNRADNLPRSAQARLRDSSPRECINFMAVERHDGTIDRYCNLRHQSIAPQVGDIVLEGQYLGRAGSVSGYPGIWIEVTAPDGRAVDLLTEPGSFELGYPLQVEILDFGVTTSEDPRAAFPAVLRPEKRTQLADNSIPVLWYRIYGAPATTVQVLEIRDSSDVIVWTTNLSPTDVDPAAMAYIAHGTASLPEDSQPAPLPPGRYTARLLLPEFPGAEASTVLLIPN
jgi:hypothetical protein